MMDMKCHTGLFFFHIHILNIPTAWEKHNNSQNFIAQVKQLNFQKSEC